MGKRKFLTTTGGESSPTKQTSRTTLEIGHYSNVRREEGRLKEGGRMSAASPRRKKRLRCSPNSHRQGSPVSLGSTKERGKRDNEKHLVVTRKRRSMVTKRGLVDYFLGCEEIRGLHLR